MRTLPNDLSPWALVACHGCGERHEAHALEHVEELPRGNLVCTVCLDAIVYERHQDERAEDYERDHREREACRCEHCQRHLARMHREWVRDSQARLAAEQGPAAAADDVEF